MAKRPIPITVLCILLGILAVLTIFGGIIAIFQAPTALRAWSLLSSCLFLVSLFLLWRISALGPLIFAVISLVNITLVFVVQISDIPSGARGWAPFIMPLIYFSVVIPYWRLLRWPSRVLANNLEK